mmetsp:Transcript_1128/g.3843  ORF Transcript_1128/g.3843 Transcript_1128/m.3843 type:complete len:168 (+) Transcript_1128:192-695(+)
MEKAPLEKKAVLSAEEIRMIQTSWATAKKAVGYKGIAVLLFQKIFDKAPETLKMFRFGADPDFDVSKDLATSPAFLKHGFAVVATVGAAVAGLDDLPSLVPTLTSLGYKHMTYNVKPDHYPVVGASFLETLRDGLGDDFTPDLEAAYTKMWMVVQKTMLAGADDDTK